MGGGDEKNKAELELNIQMECMALLTSQLEKQRQYWEDKLASTITEMKAENEKLLEKSKANFITRADLNKEKGTWERKLKSAVERSVKIQRDLDAEREMNKNLMKSKIELSNIVESQKNQIQDLSSINNDLMLHLEAESKINDQGNELQNGSIVLGAAKKKSTKKR